MFLHIQDCYPVDKF